VTSAAEETGFLHVTLCFRFVTPEKRSLAGKGETPQRDLTGFVPPHAGAPVAVLYLSDWNYAVL
jgi:hypothetical protein